MSIPCNDAATLLVLRYAAYAPAGPLIEAPSAYPPRRAGNAYAIDYTTLPGVSYQVESSTDLKTWTVANGPSGQSAANSLSTFTDTIPGTMKFYRVKPLP